MSFYRFINISIRNHPPKIIFMRQLSMNAFTLCIVFLIAFDDVYGTPFDDLGGLHMSPLYAVGASRIGYKTFAAAKVQ